MKLQMSRSSATAPSVMTNTNGTDPGAAVLSIMSRDSRSGVMMSVVPRAVQFVSIHFIAALTFPALASTRPSLEKYVCRLSNAQMLNLSFGVKVLQNRR